METGHAISVVKTNCFTAPRISRTDKPATAKELRQEQYRSKSLRQSELNGEENATFARGTRNEASGTRTVSRHVFNKQQNTFVNNENGEPVNNEQFYDNLLRLKEEHKKTLKLLETQYYNELRNQNSFQWEGFTQGVSLNQQNGFKQNDFNQNTLDNSSQLSPCESHQKLHSDRVFHKPPKSPVVQDIIRDMSHSTNVSEKDCDDSDDEEEEEEVLVHSPEEFSSSLFPKRSAAIDMVEELWKDFSVQEYSVNEDEFLDDQQSTIKKQEKEWTPAITVPKPFAMTLREAGKEKRKTRSMKMIEEDIDLKRSMEEAELKKTFRAQPVPATTFLPLYDEIIDKNNRRSKHVRELNKAILKATEKPFSFIKREEIKKQKKDKAKKASENLEEKEEHEKPPFKARPPPKNMDDLTLADRLTEQEEYRKIKKKLRAAELLAKSRLPPSMEARENISPAAKSRQKCRRAHEKKATFRPNINADIPDFEALHWEFEKDLRQKKKERQPTVTEPFNLHTARIPHQERSLRRARSMENLSGSLGSPGTNRKARPLSARLSSSQDTLPFGTTESVRLRDSVVRKSLDTKRRNDIEMFREMMEKRKRQKQLRSQVSVKAMANDHSWQLRKTKDEKLKNFRETDRGRQEEYERELSEMKQRIAQRPLLLEQQSCENAKRKAERKYTQILRDAGVDEKLVSSLVARGGGIIDDDSEDENVEDSQDFSRDSREYPAGQHNDYLSDKSDSQSEPDSTNGSL